MSYILMGVTREDRPAFYHSIATNDLGTSDQVGGWQEINAWKQPLSTPHRSYDDAMLLGAKNESPRVHSIWWRSFQALRG